MTSRTPLDHHMDDFGKQLHRVGRRKLGRTTDGTRWVRPAIGVGGLAAIGAGALALTVFPGGPGRIDVVSEAKAALADRGEIVHLVLGQTFGPVDGGPGKPVSAKTRHQFMRQNACFDQNETISLWTATTGPSRYRVAQKNYRCFAQVEFRRVIQPGALEESGYSDGVYSRYYPGEKLLTRMTDLIGSDANLVELSPAQLGLQDGQAGESEPFRDPLDRVRKLLGTGELRDAGRFTGPDGRALWKLRAVNVQTSSYRGPGDKKDIPLKITAEYVVDAKTFAPVSFTMLSRGYRDGKPEPAYASTMKFLKYERLPLNDDTEKLLEIQPVDGTETLSLTSRQVRKIYRGPTHGSAEDKEAYAKAKAVGEKNQEEADAVVEAQIRSEERTGDVPTTP